MSGDADAPAGQVDVVEGEFADGPDVNETVALLAARAPKLRQALWDAREAGHVHLVTDGRLIPVDRLAADRPFYSGKHSKRGMNLQVIASPDGDICGYTGRCPARCTT